MNFNIKTAKYTFDFTKGSMQLLTMSGPEPIVSYTSEYKGRIYFAIRKLYTQDDGGTWNPGKGITVYADQAAEFCKSVGALNTPKSVKPIKAKIGKARRA